MALYANVSLKAKVVAMAVLVLGLLTAEGALALTSRPSHGLVLAGMAVGYLAGGGLTVLIVRRVSEGVGKVVARLDAVDERQEQPDARTAGARGG